MNPNRKLAQGKPMDVKPLLTVTAFLEVGAGLALLAAPAQAAELLFGTGPGFTPAAAALARIGGAGLLSIGVTCWLERNRPGPQRGLILGLLAYNVAVPLILAYAALAENLHGLGLWPGCLLHAGLTVWCLSFLRERSDRQPG